MDVGDEAERALEVAFDNLVVQFERVEAFFDVGEFGADFGLLGLEDVDRNRGGVVGFENLAALVERAPLSGHELLPLYSCAFAEAGDLFEDVLLGLAAEVFAQFDVLVVVLDSPFDEVNEEGALVAARLVTLPADTDEVGVDRLAAAFCVADDEPAAALFAMRVSLTAEDGAFEVVVVGALLFASEVLGFELALHLVEGRLVDQWRVFPFVLDAHVAHHADVVRILEHVVERGEHERLLRALCGGAAH